MPRANKLGVPGLQREKGRYVVDFKWNDPTAGIRRRFRRSLPRGTPAAAAKAYARTVVNAALSGTLAKQRHADRRLYELLDESLKWARTNRPKTYKDRCYHVATIKRVLPDVLLSELSPMHLERLKRERRDAGNAHATVNRLMATIKHALSLGANEFGWVTLEAQRTLHRVKKLREPAGRVRYLRGDEEVRLFGQLPDHLVPIVRAAMFTGLRLSELQTLRRSQVDLQANLITVGDKHETKTGKVRRVPIAGVILSELQSLLRSHAQEFVFVDARGRPFSSRRTIGNAFARAIARADIDDFHFHDLRHEFATRLRRNGEGIDVIAKLLGHSTISMAMRYAHLDDPTLRQAVVGLRDRRSHAAE